MTTPPTPLEVCCPSCGTPIGLIDAAALVAPEPQPAGRRPRMRFEQSEEGEVVAVRAQEQG